MASLAYPAPMRTPSPKIRIHRSQSFGSPSSRMSTTPIDESPYSKSTSAIGMKPTLPRMDVLASAAHSRPLMNRRMSDDSIMSDTSSAPSSPASSTSSSSESEEEYGLFTSNSPPPLHVSHRISQAPIHSIQHHPQTFAQTQTPAILPSPHNQVTISHTSTLSPLSQPFQPLQQYQDPQTPMYDPRLVRLVLNLYDERGFDWMDIAALVQRGWGVRTGSAEVLGILCGNGRVARSWWD